MRRRQALPAGMRCSSTQMTISPVVICSSGVELCSSDDLCSSSVEVMTVVVVDFGCLSANLKTSYLLHVLTFSPTWRSLER